MEWDYSGRKGTDGQKKKIGKANERKRKVKRGKDEVNWQGGDGWGPCISTLWTLGVTRECDRQTGGQTDMNGRTDRHSDSIKAALHYGTSSKKSFFNKLSMAARLSRHISGGGIFTRNVRLQVAEYREIERLRTGLYLSNFHWGGQSFDWRLATIAGIEIAKLAPLNSLIN